MIFGFNTAVRGLLASQRALYTTNHNINNANTRGYSRQAVSQRATRPHEIPGIGFQGTGTEIYNIERVRDSFVDFKYWNESAPMGEWDIKRDSLAEIEKLIGEPSNNSFRQYMDDFYVSLDDMSKNPSDMAFRQPVRENAMAFTRHLNETAQRLQNMGKDTEYNVGIKVEQINSLSSQIADLNRQIYLTEVSGKAANDLRDRRELLVDDLSKIVNIRVDERIDQPSKKSGKNEKESAVKEYESLSGKYSVSIGGISIVDHLDTNTMVFKEVKDHVNPDENGFKLSWENGGEVKFDSGELKGLMDMLTGDGEGNTYRGIPFYENQLNDFAKDYAEKFNQQHKLGQTLKDKDGNSKNDIKFFDYDPDNPAATLSLHKDILDDIRNIAAGGQDGSGTAEDNNNLLELIKQREDKSFFPDGMSQGTPDDFIKSIMSSMAVDSLQAQRAYSTQEILQKNIGIKRQSISGVSLEEESADMVRFQHIYVASSKMITTLDALLDLTVNRLGLVGR